MKIRLTESQLKRVIKESVIRILKEDKMNELQMSTMKNAYDKMFYNGQTDRAEKLRNTAFASASNRDDMLRPDISNGSARLRNVNSPDNSDDSHSSRYNANDDMIYDNMGDRAQETDKNYYPRFKNAATARRMANNVRQLNPNTKYGKNDFQY